MANLLRSNFTRGIAAAALLSATLLLSGCTQGSASSPASASAAPSSHVTKPFAPAPGSSASTPATHAFNDLTFTNSPPSAKQLASLKAGPQPKGSLADIASSYFPGLSVSTKTLNVGGAFASGQQLTIEGPVVNVNGARTAMVRLVGPGFDGRVIAPMSKRNKVAATVILPKLTPGRWAIVVQDLGKAQAEPNGLDVGQANLDIAVYDVK